MPYRILVLLLFVPNMVQADLIRFNKLYGQLLSQYWRPSVVIHGIPTTVFDYDQMKQDADHSSSLFQQTTKAIEQIDPGDFKSDVAEKAFWINAYNFAAISLVIRHYPVDSIRSFRINLFKYPWLKKAIKIGNKYYSLKQIEKEILLDRFKDPRIIFAISCAAVSCPDRMAEPFNAECLDKQLDSMIRDFFKNEKKGAYLDKKSNTLVLAWIMKKDIELFQNNEEGILQFVLFYLEPTMRQWIRNNSIVVRYFDHDWTLNDLAQAN